MEHDIAQHDDVGVWLVHVEPELAKDLNLPQDSVRKLHSQPASQRSAPTPTNQPTNQPTKHEQACVRACKADHQTLHQVPTPAVCVCVCVSAGVGTLNHPHGKNKKLGPASQPPHQRRRRPKARKEGRNEGREERRKGGREDERTATDTLGNPNSFVRSVVRSMGGLLPRSCMGSANQPASQHSTAQPAEPAQTGTRGREWR